jgi:hypothetical protein
MLSRPCRLTLSPRCDAFAARRRSTQAIEGFNGHVFTKRMERAGVHPAFATAIERVVCGAIGGSERAASTPFDIGVMNDIELHLIADVSDPTSRDTGGRNAGDLRQARRAGAFFLSAGAEIVLETARFWASRAVPEADSRRHIRHVIGPDEYHEDVDDNAFTNVMARWNLARGLETIDLLLRARWPERGEVLWQELALTDDELADWRDAAVRIVIGSDPTTGLYEEFAGFHELEHIDLAAYADRTQPMDMVIGRERTQRSQVVKQADVVALIGLLPEAFPDGTAEANFRHYEPRCGHGSSLSAGMHALVAARLGHTDMALHYLRKSAEADLDRDPNSAGGVRIAGLGAVWQAVVLGFAGLDLAGEVPALAPKLPPAWQSLSFRFCWRGRSVAIRIAGGIVRATLTAGEAMELRIDQTQHGVTTGTPQDRSTPPSHPVCRCPAGQRTSPGHGPVDHAGRHPAWFPARPGWSRAQ